MKNWLRLIVIIWTAESSAYFVDGNDLMANMRDWELANQKSPETNYANAASYSAYIKGVYDALELTKRICAVNGTSVGQVNAIVAKFLNANPERWTEPAYFLVEEAVTSAFACKAQ